MSCKAKLFLVDCIDVMHQLIDEGIKKEVVFVGRFYPSSKTCHKCGYMNRELTLKDREWTCPVCGEHHDRDLNAAMNIEKDKTYFDIANKRLKEFGNIVEI